MNTSKKVFFLLIFGFIISLYYSYYNLSKFDKYDLDTTQHLMVRGDISNLWREAESFKKDFIQEKKKFFFIRIRIYENIFAFKNNRNLLKAI